MNVICLGKWVGGLETTKCNSTEVISFWEMPL